MVLLGLACIGLSMGCRDQLALVGSRIDGPSFGVHISPKRCDCLGSVSRDRLVAQSLPHETPSLPQPRAQASQISLHLFEYSSVYVLSVVWLSSCALDRFRGPCREPSGNVGLLSSL